MDKVLVAGATGYLGRHIVKELKKRNYWVRVLIRNEAQKEFFNDTEIDDFFIGEITKPITIKNICDDIDIVFSSIGITRQKDGLTYMDVDYQGNSNLLKEAINNNVKLFQYVSAINGDKLKNLKIFQAKEKFVEELKDSGIKYTIFRPNGFYSDMKDFLEMARKGKVYLFGQGNKKLNPIHGVDLAKACVETLLNPPSELSIGGPEILTQKEIGELALKACNKKIRIILLPDLIRKIIISTLRTFTTSKFYGPIEFFLTAMDYDNIGEVYGDHYLKDFFENEAKIVK